VYREITSCHGFASVYYFGQQDNYNVMVMDLLGPSLEDLFNKCNRRFSLKTVLQLADQLLERVDTLHARHLIHRDIKPANFVIGLGEQGNNVYCVDFGLSKRYRHPKNLQHIPHRDGRSLTGTPRYASINNHLGVEQSRRDDLESIAYVLVYFLKGSLPWQGLKAKNAQKKYRLILEKKQSVSIAQLCQGVPGQFAEFLNYARSLKFDAKPDVPYLRKLFRDLYHSQGCGAGKTWDWDPVDSEYMASGGAAAPAPAPTDEAGNPRPTTAGAVASGRPQSGWGFSSSRPQQSGGMPSATSGRGEMTEAQYPNVAQPQGVGSRPHTAGQPQRSSGGRRVASGVGEHGGEPAVASARSLIKLQSRRTAGEAGEWADGAGARGAAAARSGGAKGFGTERPRSASAVTGSGALGGLTRGQSGMQGQTTADGGADQAYSYGSLKSRFLSGTKGKTSKDSRLFNVGR